MNETIIAWATHTLNVVHGCSKPAAIPTAGLDVYRMFSALRRQAIQDGMNPEAAANRYGSVTMRDFDPGKPQWKWTQPNTSPECTRCYAETLSNNRGHFAVRAGKSPKGWTVDPWTEENAEKNVTLHPERMRTIKSIEVKDPSLPPSQRNRVFICSMGDIFHDLVPDDFLIELFEWMRRFPHIYMVLTKRPDRALRLPLRGEWPANVWLGSTVGHPATKWRMEVLRRSPAPVRFISMEPLTQCMTDAKADAHLGFFNLEGIHQVIVGGESGTGYRPMAQPWARAIRDECKKQGSAFFFKQDAAFQTERRCYLVEEDGTCKQYRQYPGEMTPPKIVTPEPAPKTPKTPLAPSPPARSSRRMQPAEIRSAQPLTPA